MFEARKCDRGLNIYSTFNKIVINGIYNATWISDCYIIVTAVGVVWLQLIDYFLDSFSYIKNLVK